MNRNIRIARALIRLAKSLVAREHITNLDQLKSFSQITEDTVADVANCTRPYLSNRCYEWEIGNMLIDDAISDLQGRLMRKLEEFKTMEAPAGKTPRNYIITSAGSCLKDAIRRRSSDLGNAFRMVKQDDDTYEIVDNNDERSQRVKIEAEYANTVMKRMDESQKTLQSPEFNEYAKKIDPNHSFFYNLLEQVFLDGVSRSELAEKIGVTDNYLRQLIARAKECFKTALTKLELEEGVRYNPRKNMFEQRGIKSSVRRRMAMDISDSDLEALLKDKMTWE